MILIIFYIIEVILFGVILRSIFVGAKLTASPAPKILDCDLSSLSRKVYVLYLLVLMGELGHRSVYTELFSHSRKHLVMVVLMIIRIERSRPHPALLKVMIRDGVFYCLCGVLLSIVSVTIWIRVRNSYEILFVPFQSILHSILASRLQLHLVSESKIDNTSINTTVIFTGLCDRGSGLPAVEHTYELTHIPHQTV